MHINYLYTCLYTVLSYPYWIPSMYFTDINVLWNLLFLFISFFRKSFWTLIRPEKPLRWLFRTTQRPKMTIMISPLCRQDRPYLLALRGAQCPKDRQHLFDNFFLSFLLLLIFIRYHYKTVNTGKHYIEKVCTIILCNVGLLCKSIPW